MAKDIVFKTPDDSGAFDYSKVLVVYDRPGSMIGPAHDMFAVDEVYQSDKDSPLVASRDGKVIAQFHHDFPWFWVAKSEIEFLDPELVKTSEDPEDARLPGPNHI